MRRALMTVTLGTVLLTGAACGTASEPPAPGGTGAPPPAAAQASAAQASAANPSPPNEKSPNTAKVCAEVQKVFNNDTAPIGAELAMMLVHKERKAKDQAAKAEENARKQLRTVAGKLKQATAGAEEAAVKAAGATSAGKLNASAADAKAFDELKSSADLNKFIDTKMADWLSPISGHCG
ncbi:MAG TPA: hypothetical protein VFO77_09515 [Actinoplanes sp.]|nr:hypothetical protein [Actinoplanes sp.]